MRVGVSTVCQSLLMCVTLCLCVLLVRVIECLKGCSVRRIEPVLFEEIHHTRNRYYYFYYYCCYCCYITLAQQRNRFQPAHVTGWHHPRTAKNKLRYCLESFV